jgi:ribosomal protein S18 acetylase RimI-like enzyme
VGAIRETTPADLDEVVELLAARSRAVFGVSEVQREQVAQSWELPGYDIGWVAVANGGIVGHAALDATHDVVHAAADPADADALLERVEQRARERGFDDVGVRVVPEDGPLYGLVQRRGFTLQREIVRMWRSLTEAFDEPRWPDDVAVRTYSDTDGERVHALLDETYAAWDLDYVPRPHDSWLAFMTDHDEFDPELFFLVERDGELVACALHWKEVDARGWVKDIVVRQDQRGRGLATALLQHAFRSYADRGVAKVGLKVDSTNPTGAMQLYERLGFVTDQRQGLWVKRL